MTIESDQAAGIAIDVVQSADRFADLRDEWRALLTDSDADGLFMTWEWQYTCWRQLECEPATIVIVRQHGTLIAVAPLIPRRSSMARLELLPSFSMLGRGNVGSDYLDIVARRGFEAMVVQLIAQWLIRRGVVLEFPRIGERSTVMQVALSLAARGWAATVVERDVAPFIDLGGQSSPQFLECLGSQHRYNYRRRLRKLERSFAVRFVKVSTEEEREEALDVLIQLHNRRWARRGGSTAFHTPELRAFHRELSALALGRGWLRLYVLRLNDRPAAAVYGFAYGGKFYFYQSGFDEAYRTYSVGMVAIGLTISAACEEGLAEYDLLHGAEPYKFLWARDVRPLTTVAVYPPRLDAFFHRAGVTARRQAGRLVRRWQQRGFDERPASAIPTNR